MEDSIKNKAEHAIWNKVFPGCVVGWVKNGEKKIIPFGHFTYESSSPDVLSNTRYDVASITKSIPTASLALALVEEGRLSLDEKYQTYVPEYTNSHADELLIRHLLTYNVRLDLPTPGVKPVQESTPEEIWNVFLTREFRHRPGTVFEYSNPPSILLTRAIENVTGKSLDVLADDYFLEPLGMKDTSFHPEIPETIPPTEIDDWRGLVQGVVHDETAYVMSKERVVGCAGIFSTASDILMFLSMLLSDGVMAGRRYFSKEMVKQMYTNQLGAIGASMGLGWELNEPRFMGTNISSRAFGKTGFTGTVCIADPEKNAAMVILSNRTFPKRGSPDGINAFRREVSDVIFSV